jgi:hypothetical protein
VLQQVEHGIQAAGIDFVSAPGEVFAFAIEHGAEREAVEVLFVGEIARVELVERGERATTVFILALQVRKCGATQFPFPGAKAGMIGPDRVVSQGRFKVTVEEALESALRSIHGD